MHRIVFYCWQSDLPNATNRGFIQQALTRAAEVIAMDDTLDVEPVVDRDTEGVSGSPDIARTILQKIASADVVVADVSIVAGRQEGRPMPNPNVMIEVGYALHALGEERVVLVFNKAFGALGQLPFDLRTRRVVSYEMSEATTERASERSALKAKFELAIRAPLAIGPRAPEGDAESPKMRCLREWQGKSVTLENVRKMQMGESRSYSVVQLVRFDELTVTIESSGKPRTIPIDQLDISYDDERNQLKLEYRQ
jgi:hypothetical protein